jgi:hypothetical protein
MNLRMQAQSDLAVTLSDGARGFGLPVVIEEPATGKVIGVDDPLYAQVSRVAFKIDPGTGVPLASVAASVAVRISELIDAGFDMAFAKGWLVTAIDTTGIVRDYTVELPAFDHVLGVALLHCADSERAVNANRAVVEAYFAELAE